MPEYNERHSLEVKNDFESRVEKAETIAEMLSLVDEVMVSDGYINKGEGGEKISVANRTGIKRFGRRAYYEAFDEKYGMAEIYMRPPEENE